MDEEEDEEDEDAEEEDEAEEKEEEPPPEDAPRPPVWPLLLPSRWPWLGSSFRTDARLLTAPLPHCLARNENCARLLA